MKSRHSKRARVLRSRSRGQSIVLIALILALLIGLAALSVDVGNAYAEQRAAQRASNAAALEGMRVVVAGGTRQEIYNAITRSLDGNRIKWVEDDENIEVKPGERKLKAILLKGDGSAQPVMEGSGDEIPSDVNYVQVKLEGIQATNFAVVAGQATLPVVAESYANADVCPPYPIAVEKDAFYTPQLGTVKGDTVYSDNLFKKKPMRRMFLRDDPDASPNANPSTHTPGQFVWIQWNNGQGQNPSDALAQALRDPSKAILQYGEAPRPPGFPNEPATYPDRPGIPSAWDVMYGTQTMSLGSGYKTGSTFDGKSPSKDEEAVLAQLKWHVDNRTYMNLPEYDVTANGIREGGRYRIRSFGGYMIAGFGYIAKNSTWLQDPNGGQDLTRGSGWFLDLVKVGPPLNCATNQSAVFLNDAPIKLAGSIKIRPELSSRPSSRKPVDIVIVLDASGSMNWNWQGIGTASSTLISDLQNVNAVPSGAGVGKDINCSSLLALAKGCQSRDAYSNVGERRLYKAKQAVKGFIEGFNWIPQDRAAVVTYNGSNASPGTLTKIYPSTGLTSNIKGAPGTGSLQDLLISQAASLSPGSTNESDLYTTCCGSPGALGLQRAKQLIDSGPSGDRERVVIFLTDGLLNVGLDGVGKQETIEANWDKSFATNPPINQAVNQSYAIRDETDPRTAKIYVLALGNTFLQSGLDYISSTKAPPFLDTANSPDALPGLLSKIGQNILNGDCDPSMLEPQVPPADTMVRLNGGAYQQSTDDNGDASLGVVTVRDANGNPVTKADIKEDGTFEIPNLQPNTTYKLSFNRHEDDPVFYQGEDGVAREYSLISATGSDVIEWRTSQTSIGTTQYVLDGTPVLLLLDGTLCLTGTGPASP